MNCLIYFMIGGSLMATLKFVSAQSNMISGVLGALPIFSGLFLLLNIVNGEKTISQIVEQARGSVFGMSVGVVFYLTIYIALQFRIRSAEAFMYATGLSMMIVVVSMLLKGSVSH